MLPYRGRGAVRTAGCRSSVTRGDPDGPLEEPLVEFTEWFGVLLVCVVVLDAEGTPSHRPTGRLPGSRFAARRFPELRPEPVDLGGREVKGSAGGA
jgi:hypothetical protein